MAMAFAAYFDDSNSHDGADFILWAGMAGYQSQWDLLDARWRAILDEQTLPYFSMSGSLAGEPPFNRPEHNRAWRDGIIYMLRNTIFAADVYPIATGIAKPDYAELVTDDMAQWIGGPGTVCLIQCMDGAQERARKRGFTGDVTMFFDGGVNAEAREAALFAGSVSNLYETRNDTFGFLPVKKTPALQAADMFAWELQNDFKNYRRDGLGRKLSAHYEHWRRKEQDVLFLERDQIAWRLKQPDFQKVLNDKLWNKDGTPKAGPTS